MIDNWHINNSRKYEKKDLKTLKATDRKTDPIKERTIHIEDKGKNLIKERCVVDVMDEDKEK